MERTSFTVTELNAHIKQLLDADMLLGNVCVTGELSNAATTCNWNYLGKSYKINLIDTPGHAASDEQGHYSQGHLRGKQRNRRFTNPSTVLFLILS